MVSVDQGQQTQLLLCRPGSSSFHLCWPVTLPRYAAKQACRVRAPQLYRIGRRTEILIPVQYPKRTHHPLAGQCMSFSVDLLQIGIDVRILKVQSRALTPVLHALTSGGRRRLARTRASSDPTIQEWASGKPVGTREVVFRTTLASQRRVIGEPAGRNRR